MTDVLAPEARSRCMRRIASAGTAPEMAVRRWLWSRGYRYRVNVRRLPGTPDIVLRRYGLVIFVHGCFWHGHDTHLHMPKSNVKFWADKIARNRARDARVRQQLLAQGWNVLTIWECQLRGAERQRTLDSIEYYINHSYLLKQQPQPLAAEPSTPYGAPADIPQIDE